MFGNRGALLGMTRTELGGHQPLVVEVEGQTIPLFVPQQTGILVKHHEAHTGFKSVLWNSPEKICELEERPIEGGLGRRRQ
jgi:hypothetical protein